MLAQKRGGGWEWRGESREPIENFPHHKKKEKKKERVGGGMGDENNAILGHSDMSLNV